jgi:hypothetical protein
LRQALSPLSVLAPNGEMPTPQQQMQSASFEKRERKNNDFRQ